MEYKCIQCNKLYSSYQSLWIHNKKYHTNNSNIKQITSTNINYESTKIYNCKYCNKSYDILQSRWKHELKCKNKADDALKLELVKEETKVDDALKLELAKEETKILKLKLKLQKSTKIDNISLKKLNKILIESRNKNIQNNIINNNNNIINNYNLIGFGKEDVNNILSNQDKKVILNAKYGCLEKLIEIVHCGNYNQFKNIVLTNINDSYMYKYDDTKGYFILATKADVINALIDYRICDLEVIYNDFVDLHKLDKNTKDIIEAFINKIHCNELEYTDYDGVKHTNYKQYKISEIKILLFNNQDKINNDISLLLSTV